MTAKANAKKSAAASGPKTNPASTDTHSQSTLTGGGKTALLIGATGATGAELLQQLLAHPDYSAVLAFARRPIHCEHPKLSVHLVDFDDVDSWQHLLVGDELFSAMGTTLKLAGSKEAQYKVDFTYQLHVAEAARDNEVSRLFLVSSPGANAKSRNFYLRTKGELEHAVIDLCYDHCVLIKPGLIEAERPEGRVGEKMAGMALHKMVKLIPAMHSMTPINASQLASAIIAIAQSDLKTGTSSFAPGELLEHVKQDNNQPAPLIP
ncbi:MAG: NAD(P)H-binding protein [Gammaproteobacteria bacterium]|nr:NAD(P)H-binding protein [Gammaproteobacteria bacterium]MBT8150622.1 NAD(P)H-binding protein [Gammaproteobacteria bacterium]NND38826.1 NAD(P)H-binding protein [Pseudomonadales bacterium]NNL10259.1 NAD(P)H-binding protein [Pseudomonadales bacterium]NNM10897.1 NAD(P)H-binding protein [Pseudomonadales bacterium]